MKLKTSIFIWVTLAAVLPLAVLAYAITAYSEKRFEQEVANQSTRNLENMRSEIDRRLYYEYEMIKSLGNSQTMAEFLPVLESLDKGEVHERHPELRERLSIFLGSFQTVVPGFRAIRVLTNNNKTVIKVSKAEVTVPVGDSKENLYIDEPNGGERVTKRLRETPSGDLSMLSLPHSQSDWSDDLRAPPMLNAVFPLVSKGKRVGYLVVTFSGEQIDKLMETATKAYGGSFIIAELNDYRPQRNGLILFNDFAKISFAGNESASMNLMQIDGGRLWNALQKNPDRQGQYTDSRNVYQTFYMEYLPYKTPFVTWIIAIRINLEEVRAPFNRIRVGIYALTCVVLLLGLLLARWGAQKLASPITKLASSLKAYADGNHDTRIRVEGNAEEIQQLEQSFNYMADNIDKAQSMMLQSAKLASIGQMAAGIGHEINNPLNNIMSLVKLIERATPQDNERLMQDLKSLREEGERASEIIKGVLNFARQVPPQYNEFDVRPWIEETIRLVNQAAKNKMVRLSYEQSGEFALNADRSQLQQVLVNLVLNAIQASPEQSEIKLRVEEDLKRLKIQVIDAGEGVKKEFLSSIYDPFFTTKPEGEGTGLGLSISLGIVERHNGTLVIENNKDKGVTATITLPYGDDI